MKALMLGKKIKMEEAIKPKVGLLVDTPTLKQEIVKEDGKLILRSHELQSNNEYKSVVDIDVYLDDKDILIKIGEGYNKPVNPYIQLSDKEIKAIETINKRLI